MQTYTIELNEGQRKILETALRTLTPNANQVFSKQEGSGCGAFETEYEEYECLKEMFINLPKEELECPKCVHGFCL